MGVYLVEARKLFWRDERWHKCSLAYKIGSAEDPEKRLKGLQVGSFAPLFLISAFDCWDSRAMERWLHSMWQCSRLRGEWFKPEPFIYEAFCRLEKLFAEVPETAYEQLHSNMHHDGWLYRHAKGQEYVKPTWLMQHILAHQECQPLTP